MSRRIGMTEQATLFLVEARAVLARADAAELVLSEMGGLKRGTLSIYASQTIASYWLHRYLVAFRRAHPGIEIRLTAGNTTQVAAAIHSGLAELGLIEGVVEDPVFKILEVARDQLVVVVGPEHPWVLQPDITPRQLVVSEWVLREPALCANDDETKHPVKFRLWVSRRMFRGDAEFSRRDDSRREWRHRRCA